MHPDPMVAFWRRTPLAQMTRAQWESLCDGCGRCCVVQTQAPTGALRSTNVACRLLDIESGRCMDYGNRRRHVPECLTLRPAMVAKLEWLPETCAYRLVGEGRELPDWHPLVSGDPASVRRAGISVRGRVVSGRDVELPFEERAAASKGRRRSRRA